MDDLENPDCSLSGFNALFTSVVRDVVDLSVYELCRRIRW
jgi:hypothetical protein